MNCFVCRFSKLLDSQTLQCIGAHSTLFSIFCKSAYLLFHSIAVPFCTCVCVRLHQRNWRKKNWRVYRMIQAILRLKKLLQILFYEWVTHDSSFRAINAECARIWSDNLQLACVQPPTSLQMRWSSWSRSFVWETPVRVDGSAALWREASSASR